MSKALSTLFNCDVASILRDQHSPKVSECNDELQRVKEDLAHATHDGVKMDSHIPPDSEPFVFFYLAVNILFSPISAAGDWMSFKW